MFGLSLNLEIECVLKEPIRFVGKKKNLLTLKFFGVTFRPWMMGAHLKITPGRTFA